MADASKVTAPVSDDILADRLGLSTREFQRYRKQGLVVVAVHEQGSDAIKVTCQLGNRIWEGVVVFGSIAFEEVRFVRGVRSRKSFC
ncbi:hypothetical protein [Rhizobium anhuiense]|uniref:hypothetical protein n=1 Tax=Rhizobium anhuiense TaxID=1184720 RepID=UPI001FE08E9E|nr:hypothetical protein [Rhizobium anhuiense]